MSYEGYIAVISLVLSIIIGIGGLRKGKADTFVSYQEALAKAQERIDKLEVKYTDLMNKYDVLSEQYRVMEEWNRMLVNQLKEAGISPITLSQAKKLNGR